ncbi:DNA damage-binding protein 2 [Collichthys lucidus]|uniref:DNA damage-binding protein 2 n=1 Tax=Collichthys lucidus TaxID=240159 RepID=A0A4U5UHE2_COLLU|nr:DNA damage-binding protein 2 [Collichthys lucidus]
MKRKPMQVDATGSKGKGKKRTGEDTAPTLSKKLRDRKDGETSKQGPPLPPQSAGVQKRSGHGSILHFIYKSTLGQSLHSQMRQMGPGDSLTDMKFNQLNPTQLFTSSMGGTDSSSRFQWDNSNRVCQHRHSENGAGDFIGGIKFCPKDVSKVYVASGEGTLTLQSFEGCTPTLLSRTQECGHDHHNVCYWYCCLDVSVSRQMLVTGDNMGQLVLLGLDGQKIFSDKLHKAKVTHAEFNPRCDWLLATASVDHTVKLWDLRNIKDKKSFLHELPHEKAVNSAYFNPTDCSKLLTTDQYDEIRVYSSSDWSKPQHIIQHPHRQFQHLTPIKATWHPVYDLIVAGRYPDSRVCPGDQRTIDIFDSNTAELVCQLQDPAVPGIKSVNKFNPLGDVIGSGMGVTVLVWNRSESLISEQNKEEETSASVENLRGQRRSQQRSSRDRRGPAAVDAKLKKKLASLEETKTKTKDGCTKQKQAQMKKKK